MVGGQFVVRIVDVYMERASFDNLDTISGCEVLVGEDKSAEVCLRGSDFHDGNIVQSVLARNKTHPLETGVIGHDFVLVKGCFCHDCTDLNIRIRTIRVQRYNNFLTRASIIVDLEQSSHELEKR